MYYNKYTIPNIKNDIKFLMCLLIFFVIFLCMNIVMNETTQDVGIFNVLSNLFFLKSFTHGTVKFSYLFTPTCLDGNKSRCSILVLEEMSQNIKLYWAQIYLEYSFKLYLKYS